MSFYLFTLLAAALGFGLAMAFMPRRFVTCQGAMSGLRSAGFVTALIAVQASDSKGRAQSFGRDMKIMVSSSTATGTIHLKGEGEFHGSRGYAALPAGASSVSFRYVDGPLNAPILTFSMKRRFGWKLAHRHIAV